MSSLNLKKTAVIALCLTLVMSGCGKMEKTQNDSRSPKTAESTSDESIADSPDESTDSSETSEPESKKKPAHMTIGSNGAKAVTDAKAGKIEYRLDKTNIIHCPIGKASFGVEKLEQNFNTLVDAVVKAKPAAAKGQYLKSITVASTMGPGIRVSTAKYGN